MPVLNHHILACADKDATARFFAEILGLGQPVPFGPFAALQVSGDTTLDFMDTDGEVASQYYAFLASEAEFDDGRGLYFADPNGHSLEVLARPYGSTGTGARHPHPLAGD